jgi:hypothetical protein
MAKLSLLAGTTSKLIQFAVDDSSSTTGAGLTGLVYNTSSLTAYYYREGAGSSTAITLATMTLGTWATGGFIVVDGTHMPGLYQLGIPNAAIAAGAKSCVVMLTGATNMAPVRLEIELTALDNQDSVRAGLTALPNAAAAASGGLVTGDSTNSVKIQAPIKRNAALSNFPFQMIDSAGALLTGLTVASAVSIDGGSFAATVNSVTELANGWYALNLVAADMNGTIIKLRFSAASAADTDLTLFTLP